MSDSKTTFETAVDITLRIGILLLLIAWCFQILYPFFSIVLWAIILAVAMAPFYNKMKTKLGNRGKLAASLITLMALGIIAIPSYLFVDSMVRGISDLGSQIEAGDFKIPPPPQDVIAWPIIGKSLYNVWDLASSNLEDLFDQYGDNLASIGSSMLNSIVGTGLSILQFVLSTVIAGVLLATSEDGAKRIRSLFNKLVGERGEEFTHISEITVRNVVKGILGVAVIQAVLAGLGFVFAGVPYAGLWALIVLFLAVIQVGPTLVIVPVIIYLYSTTDALPASLWTIYLVVVALSDNFLKPILLGAGAPVPMLVIFLGAIGGFITSGFIGLFTGAIVLSLGYKLFQTWLVEDAQSSTADGPGL